MDKILVTYATLAGATAEAARAIGDELAAAGCAVDVLPLADVTDPGAYTAVVVGGPMIMGWHRAALGFLRRHRGALRRVPVAVFVLAMTVTETGTRSVRGVPVHVDAGLPKPPANPGRLTLRERYARVDHYLAPIVAALRPGRPAALALFGGRLEYGRLPWWAVLFALLVVRAPAGDRRDWPALRAWAAALPQALGLRETLRAA